jgi:geranylgeranyl diphosphate synthase type I
MLGIWGAEEGIGKPVGADIRRKKKSLPIVYAMSRASGPVRDRLVDVYSKPSLDDDDVSTVLGILEEMGVVDYCQETAKARLQEALAQWEPLGLTGDAYRELKEVAEFLVEREF